MVDESKAPNFSLYARASRLRNLSYPPTACTFRVCRRVSTRPRVWTDGESAYRDVIEGEMQ